jgi:hypothetical protein
MCFLLGRREASFQSWSVSRSDQEGTYRSGGRQIRRRSSETGEWQSRIRLHSGWMTAHGANQRSAAEVRLLGARSRAGWQSTECRSSRGCQCLSVPSYCRLCGCNLERINPSASLKPHHNSYNPPLGCDNINRTVCVWTCSIMTNKLTWFDLIWFISSL